MSGVITTGSNPKLLSPGINKIWSLTYELWDKGAEWRKIFPVYPSDRNYEEDVALTGLGLAINQPEGDAVQYDTMKQAFVTRYQHTTYGLGYIITKEEIEDNQYPQVSAQRTRALAYSMFRTQEIVGANVLNRAFNGAYPGGDGVSLCNSAHPLESGTFSNILPYPSTLNEAALEQAAIDIEGFVDNRGLKIAIMPSQLIIPRHLQFEATRILKNAKNRPETANRDINALYMMNTYSDGIIVNHYLLDPTVWFVQTDCPDGLKCFERIKTQIGRDNDFDTDNAKIKARSRYCFYWTDPRGLYGSEGA